MVFLYEGKIIFELKSHQFLNKTNTIKNNVRIIICDNADESKTLKENFSKHSNMSTFNLHN